MDDFIIDEIESVEVISEDEVVEVYDVGMVDSPHTFFANDILVHNSVFLSSKNLINLRYPGIDFNNVEDIVKKTIAISIEVRDVINKAYDKFAFEKMNLKNHRFDIKQEFVAKAGLWIAKKRYAQLIVSQEGRMFDEPKLDVKGIDVVRSNFPQSCRDLMNDLLMYMLVNKTKNYCDELIDNYKKVMENTDVVEIAKPTGINDIDKYELEVPDDGLTVLAKGIPAHTRSAYNYNDILRLFNIHNVPPMKSGEKIKWAYLVNNPLNIPSIAFRDVDEEPPEILKILSDYVDFDKMFDSNLTKKLNSLYNAMGWGDIIESNLDVKNKYFS